MKPKLIIALAGILVLGSAVTARPAHAFGVSGAGAKVGVSAPEDLDGTPMIEGHVELEQPGTRVHLQPNVSYWKVNGERDMNPNLDVYYHFKREGRVTPYVGSGLGLHFRNDERFNESSTEPGVNVFGGVRVPAASNHFFMETRYTASDVSQFSVMGGMTFHTR